MRKRVAFFEFPVFRGVYPLASGYLEATACRNPQVKELFEFEKHSFPVNDSSGVEEIFDQIEADVYAFSCYVWNSGLVRRLLASLLSRRPDVHVILGGPQVMNKPDQYLDPKHKNLVLCNGEGEYIFAEYIAQIATGEPDLSKVNGLSFYRDGEVVTTPKPERISDLDALPSPFLEGYLDSSRYHWAVMETNRGCPFKCTYCYWGGAINAKVNKHTEERIFEELTWLSENKVFYILFADANFGLLKRDVDIARHLAECKRKNGFPLMVYFSSSKNTPERVSEITKIFNDEGLASAQPISLQTMSAEALSSVKRSNIRTSSYTELQRDLNARGMSSFLEMIWPLPGETLDSFRDGIGQLCRLGADCFMIYPLLLINNVEMDTQREEYGLVAVDDPDPNSEAKIVIETRDVSNAEYLDGLRFAYHVTGIYTLRSLGITARYLDSTGKMEYADLISAFSDFCKEHGDNPYTEYIESTIGASEQYKYTSTGGIPHVALHAGTVEFDKLIYDFIRTLSFWDDDQVKFRFELDLLNRPHVYRNTPVVDKNDKMEIVRIQSVMDDGYVVEIPPGYYEQAKDLLHLGNGTNGNRAQVKYRSNQLPFMRAKSLDENLSYCQDKLHKMGSILPAWSTA